MHKRFLILIFLVAIIPDAEAYSCDSLSYAVDQSERWLKRASRESDLDSAQHYVRKAQNSLEEAAYAARDCGCEYAASEFEEAATKARRAKNASDVDDFLYQFRRAVRAYNSAIDAISSCEPNP